LATSKTNKFCETSSFFEVDNIKNEAILRDFLQKWKVESRADGLVPMRFTIFPVHLSEVLCLPRKSDARSYEVLRLSRKIIFPKTEDLMLQNATPLRKSAPGPPSSSDEHVSCTAPATENASLQILFKCPTPAIVFGNATKHYKALTFCSLLTRCTIPCACHAKTTLQRPKVARTCGVLCVLTSKSALRHNDVQFFISHLASWLRTRHFSKRLFIGKTHVTFLPLFAHLDLLSSETFSFLICFLLFFSSLTLPISAFHLSILSEV